MTKTVSIPEVLFFQEGPGVRNTQFKTEGVKLLNVGNINNGKISLDTTKIYISESEAYGRYSHFLIDEGDLVIASSGIVVDNFHNKIAFVESHHLPLCLNTSTIRFKPLKKSIIDINYVKYYLQTDLFKGQLKRLITGSAQLNFGPSHIKQIQIPLPSFTEQRRIAALLDQADALLQKDRQLLSNYDQLAQSLFLTLFGDPVQNEKEWEVKRLNELSTQIVDCPHSTPNHQDEPTDFLSIRTTDMSAGTIVWNRMKYVQEKEFFERTRRLVPKEGDVIYGREGSFGDAVIVPPNTKICLGQRVMLFRPKQDQCNSVYFWAIVRSNRVYNQAVQKTAGSTVGHVNIKDIINFTVPVPPLSLQNHFAGLIEQLEKQKAVVRQQLAASEALFGRLLQESFG